MEENRLYESPQEGYSLCIWVKERLPDLQEGYLDAMTMEAVRAHLSVCFLCMKEYNELEQTVRMVENLPFVEPLRDYSPEIMAAIESQSGHSFQDPVVEVEAEALRRASLPRTATGGQRLFGFQISNLRFPIRKNKPDQRNFYEPVDQISPQERAAVALTLLGSLVALIFSPFGRAAVGVGGALGNGVLRITDSVSHVPVLGVMAGLIFELVREAGDGAIRLLQTAYTSPLATVYLSLFGAGMFAWAARNRTKAWQLM